MCGYCNILQCVGTVTFYNVLFTAFAGDCSNIDNKSSPPPKKDADFIISSMLSSLDDDLDMGLGMMGGYGTQWLWSSGGRRRNSSCNSSSKRRSRRRRSYCSSSSSSSSSSTILVVVVVQHHYFSSYLLLRPSTYSLL